jgi:hypothetical protein
VGSFFVNVANSSLRDDLPVRRIASNYAALFALNAVSLIGVSQFNGRLVARLAFAGADHVRLKGRSWCGFNRSMQRIG